MFKEETDVGGVPCLVWTIQDRLPKNKKQRERAYRLQMIIFTYAIYSFFNIARKPLSVLNVKMLEECSDVDNSTKNSSYVWCTEGAQLSSTTEGIMGIMDAAYLASHGITLYLSGIIADCYNPRYYLTMGCVLSGFFCALLGLSNYWNLRSINFLSTTLILMGAAQSTGWPVVLSCVTHWYSGSGMRATFFGFWNTHNYLGGILGLSIAGLWADENWGMSFFVPGFMLACMGLLVFLCLVVDPEDLKKLDEKLEKKNARRPSKSDLPTWISSSRSLKLSDALRLPGVIEFSASMFFSRMVGYTFKFWLPSFVKQVKDVSARTSVYYSLTYILGGSIGGIGAGLLVDISQRSSLVCATSLLVSIPVLFLGHISKLGERLHVDLPVILLMGIFVEGPYIVTSTSVSADLGTHKMIKRSHRALSTVGGIIEGTGALGASIGTYVFGWLMPRKKWTDILFIMMGLQFVGFLCLTRQAYEDFFKKKKGAKPKEAWKLMM